MRYLRIPEAIQLFHPVSKEKLEKVFPFAEFIRGLLQDKRFMRSYKTIAAAQRLDALMDTRSGEIIAVESFDWDILKAVVDEPEGGYLGPALQLLPFMQAVLGALETDPRINGEKVKPQELTS